VRRHSLRDHGPPAVVVHCHCTECQRSSPFGLRDGGGHPQDTPHHQGRAENVRATDQRHQDDGGWFCADCGTRLYHMPGGASYPNRNIKPGTLDDTSWLVPTIHSGRGARRTGWSFGRRGPPRNAAATLG